MAGFNVNAIVLEVPITMTSDGQLHGPDDPSRHGTYGTIAAAPQKAAQHAWRRPSLSDNFVQIQRMGNALINELLIGTGDKDKFSMSEPEDDAQFANYLLDPLLARVINAAYGVPCPFRRHTARPRTARPLYPRSVRPVPLRHCRDPSPTFSG